MFIFINSFKLVLFKSMLGTCFNRGYMIFAYIKLYNYNSLIYNSNKTVILKYMYNNNIFYIVPDSI